MTPLEGALFYAKRGLPVFPAVAGEKFPAINGWYGKATADLRKINTWFSSGENNVAVRTGHYEGRILLVIDVDVKTGKVGDESFKNLVGEFGPLPRTLTTRTASGGYHYFFWVPEAVATSASKFRKDIDILCQGSGKGRGHVIGAGSMVENGTYETADDSPIAELPQTWFDKIKEKSVSISRKKNETPFVKGVDLNRAIKRAAHYLQNEAPPAIEGSNGDNTTILVANQVGDFGVPLEKCVELMAEFYDERCIPPWGLNELKEKVTNAYNSRQSAVGLSAPETQFGKVDQGGSEFPAQESRPKNETTAPTKNTAAKRRISFTRWDDWKPDFNKRDLVEGLLGQGEISAAYGAPNDGKSWLALEIGVSLAAGTDFLGRKVQQSAVVYVVAEGASGSKKRAEAYRKRRGLTALPLAFIEDSVDLHGVADTEALIETIREVERKSGRVGMVILDTLARVMGGDENKTEDMNAFNARVAKIAKETGAHVMIIHHSGKDASKGARGSTALRAAIDTELRVEKKQGGTFVVTVTKQRDREFVLPLAFRLENVVIKQEAGDLVESCVVVPADAPKAQDPLTEKTRKIFDSLQLLAGIFDTKPVPIDDWRRAVYADLNTEQTTVAIRKAFYRARKELEAAARIQITDDSVTLLGGEYEH